MQNEVQFDKREWESYKRGQYDYVTYSLMLMLFTLHYIHKTAIASFNVIELQQLSCCTLNWVIEVMEKAKKKKLYTTNGWRLIFEIASILLIDKYCDIYTIWGSAVFLYENVHFYVCCVQKKRVEVKGRKKKLNLCSCLLKH